MVTGFRVKRGSDTGFVTAAHVAPTANKACTFNKATCGTVKAVSSATDASFVAVNTDVYLNCKIALQE